MNEEKYKIYVTDALKIITEIIAHSIRLDFTCNRFYDMVHPQTSDHILNLSPEEIVENVLRNTGIKIIDNMSEE